MILIVDSGSTKSDWVLLDNQSSHQQFTTIGFNPLFHNSEFVISSIQANEALVKVAPNITKVFYYGASCSSEERKQIIAKSLQFIFKNADVKVDHDLTASALATYTGEPSIACILGTGSNSCYIENHSVTEVIPSLGYVLGDEASGSYFGKKLLSAYLYYHLPNELFEAFQIQYQLTKEDIFEKVYKQANANVFLASFMPFYGEHKSHPFLEKILIQGFEEFIKTHVWCYPNYTKVKTNFIGSISFYFEKQLRQAAKNSDVQIGEINQKPMEGLIRYHQLFK